MTMIFRRAAAKLLGGLRLSSSATSLQKKASIFLSNSGHDQLCYLLAYKEGKKSQIEVSLFNLNELFNASLFTFLESRLTNIAS